MRPPTGRGAAILARKIRESIHTHTVRGVSTPGRLAPMEDAQQQDDSAEVLEYLAWLDQIAVGVDL